MKFWIFGFSFAIFVLLAFFLYQYDRFSEGVLRVIFCDVGQGDAIFFRLPDGYDVLVDGGPDSRVLECIERNMPFWDREIDVVFATHGHADHVSGLIEVFNRYSVRSFYTQETFGGTEASAVFLEMLDAHEVEVKYLFADEKIVFEDGVVFETLWPEKLSSQVSVNDMNPNENSLVQLVRYSDFEILLTGDVDFDVLEKVYPARMRTEVLKVPHQGSKNGLSKRVVGIIQPRVSVISVGNNTYGHPHEAVLQLLEESKSRVFRTDEHGDITVVSDGSHFQLLTGR